VALHADGMAEALVETLLIQSAFQITFSLKDSTQEMALRRKRQMKYLQHSLHIRTDNDRTLAISTCGTSYAIDDWHKGPSSPEELVADLPPITDSIDPRVGRNLIYACIFGLST
jgi:hypothetical protein